MRHYKHLLESKDLNAGDTLFDIIITSNLLVFVIRGTLLISNKTEGQEIKLDEGHFILLPAGIKRIAMAITESHVVVICAEVLSSMILNDPEWNPEHSIVLPIFPTLAQILSQIEYLQKENRTEFN